MVPSKMSRIVSCNDKTGYMRVNEEYTWDWFGHYHYQVIFSSEFLNTTSKELDDPLELEYIMSLYETWFRQAVMNG